MKMTQHSLPGDSRGGFSAYGGIQPGQLGRMSHAPGSETTRSMGPCFCLCGGAPEAKETTRSMGPCFCLCGGAPEAQEMTHSMGPCFCLCGGAPEAEEMTPVHEAEEMTLAAPGFCLCSPAHEADA
jgi:hypothetical protein